MEEAVLCVEKVSKKFRRGIIAKNLVQAVDEVSFQINENEVFGLVGESGSGKTTILKIIFGLIEPTLGRVMFQGKEVTTEDKKFKKFFRQKAQVVFQDPYSSLNPRKTVKNILRGAASITCKTASEQDDKVKKIMELVGLDPWKRYLERFPHELSGGERQRVGIARALVNGATFVGADEPVSNLDVSVRAVILNLFKALRSDFGLTMLLVSHDLAVVRSLADTIGVMYRGKVVEIAKGEEIFLNPIHPYTQLLLGSCLLPNPIRERLRNPMVETLTVVSNEKQKTGCPFYTRCLRRKPVCLEYQPKLELIDKSHAVACNV
jgi:oligopeptide/dipeptide ABC transporter ATP-binding protein